MNQLEDFRREICAITPSGQIKSGVSRHEKNDRFRIDDRSRFVLGWSNREKISHLTPDEQQLFALLQANLLGTNLRLEQERIGYGWLLDAL